MSTSRPPLRDSYEGLYKRARSLAQTGDLEQASELYRRLVDRLGRLSDRILARRPDLHALHRQARLEFSSLLAAEARYAEAIEVEQALLETHPDESDQWRRDMAVLRAAKGDVEMGLSELRELAQESPDEPGRWIILAMENRLAGRLSESQAALDQALAACQEGDTDSLADAHYQRFLLFKEMRQPDDAMAAWEEAVKQNPEVVRTVREVYAMLTESGRYSEAQRYIARDDNALQAGFQEGLIASLTGKPVGWEIPSPPCCGYRTRCRSTFHRGCLHCRALPGPCARIPNWPPCSSSRPSPSCAGSGLPGKSSIAPTGACWIPSLPMTRPRPH
jgi:tetratricopeptide (TPR) repeat protein